MCGPQTGPALRERGKDRARDFSSFSYRPCLELVGVDKTFVVLRYEDTVPRKSDVPEETRVRAQAKKMAIIGVMPTDAAVDVRSLALRKTPNDSTESREQRDQGECVCSETTPEITGELLNRFGGYRPFCEKDDETGVLLSCRSD